MNRLLFLSAALGLAACGGPSKGETTATENPSGDNPCDANPCGANPCGANPCGDEAQAAEAMSSGISWSGWQSWTQVNEAAFVSKGHKKPWVNVYVPPDHVEAYAALEGEMPEGFAVVKSVHTDANGAAGDVMMLTVMAKMGKDYDPENGNWYYAAMSADGTKAMKEGKLEMCIGCHSSGKDYLFGTK